MYSCPSLSGRIDPSTTGHGDPAGSVELLACVEELVVVRTVATTGSVVLGGCINALELVNSADDVTVVLKIGMAGLGIIGGVTVVLKNGMTGLDVVAIEISLDSLELSSDGLGTGVAVTVVLKTGTDVLELGGTTGVVVAGAGVTVNVVLKGPSVVDDTNTTLTPTLSVPGCGPPIPPSFTPSPGFR